MWHRVFLQRSDTSTLMMRTPYSSETSQSNYEYTLHHNLNNHSRENCKTCRDNTNSRIETKYDNTLSLSVTAVLNYSRNGWWSHLGINVMWTNDIHGPESLSCLWNRIQQKPPLQYLKNDIPLHLWLQRLWIYSISQLLLFFSLEMCSYMIYWGYFFPHDKSIIENE
jgi:hypothetical protein